MKDINIRDGVKDFEVFDTQVYKAKNILNTQVATLEYAQASGIDLEFFLAEGMSFQTESFNGYLVETLANQGVNVNNVRVLFDTFTETISIELAAPDSTTALISR